MSRSTTATPPSRRGTGGIGTVPKTTRGERDGWRDGAGESPDRFGQLLPRPEAARVLGVGRGTLRRWIAAGQLATAPGPDGRPWVRLTEAAVAAVGILVRPVLVAWRRDKRAAGARLRARREEAGLSQLDLAAASGLTHEAISLLELGRRAPQARTLLRLTRALGTEPAELVATEPPATVVTATELAHRLGVADGTVVRWLKAGLIPGTKVAGHWRIPEGVAAELEAAKRRRRSPKRRVGPPGMERGR